PGDEITGQRDTRQRRGRVLAKLPRNLTRRRVTARSEGNGQRQQSERRAPERGRDGAEFGNADEDRRAAEAEAADHQRAERGSLPVGYHARSQDVSSPDIRRSYPIAVM